MIGTAVALLLVGMAVAMGLSSDNNPDAGAGREQHPGACFPGAGQWRNSQSAPANPPPQRRRHPAHGAASGSRG